MRLAKIEERKGEITVPQDRFMSTAEWFAISRRLEAHHSVFYMLWELGRPVFTDRIPTAAVSFQQGRAIEFLLNPAWWDSRTPEQQDFVLAHECMHVLLGHGRRIKDLKDPALLRIANLTLDVVVNHLLLDQFLFDRNVIDPDNHACWLDTVFPGRTDIEPEQNFEYYFNRLLQSITFITVGVGTLDDHSMLGDGDLAAEVVERLADQLSEEEKEALANALDEHLTPKEDEEGGGGEQGGTNAGSSPGDIWKTMTKVYVAPKRKWEEVIKRWALNYLRSDYETTEHWLRVQRRTVLLPDAALLPTEMEEQEKPNEGRIHVDFFLDTSGSCSHLAERFWKAARSLPRHRFEARLWCFDTKTYAVSLEEGKLRGFGGTRFDVIEHRIQATMKEKNEKYPDAVFVITDGYGSSVSPAKPKNWYWFLTPDGTESHIPAEAHVFNLSKFE